MGDVTPRICVCRTIGQCIVAKPDDEGDFHLYELILPECGPEAPVRSKVKDFFQTQEYRIIDKVVEADGGKIRLTGIARLPLIPALKLYIQTPLCQPTYPLSIQQEFAEIWSDTSDGKLFCKAAWQNHGYYFHREYGKLFDINI